LILCVGFSPTVQRTMRFNQRIAPDAVHRAAQVWTTASGKAVNVARIASQLGARSHLVQPLGGETGRLVERLLDADGVEQTIVDTPGRLTRTCSTLLDGSTTELVEEAPPLKRKEIDRLLALTARRIGESRLLCISGSLPDGVSVEIVDTLISLAREASVDVLIDATRGPLLTALRHGPWLAKPNRSEACASLGLPMDTDVATVAQAVRAAGARNSFITDGAGLAALATEQGTECFAPLEVQTVNPIGSGDAVAAALAVATKVRGMEWPLAGKFALAVAAANCLTPTSGVIDRAEVERFFDA